MEAVDEVLFESDSVRVTTRSVRVDGRTWGLEHVCGVTVLLQRPSDLLLRAQPVYRGRSSTTARALAQALREALRHRRREPARDDAA